ncbi:MAG: CusA/CzcA family heavy metal efflux RND transporter [Verrucomicrobiales bacterium]|nr:CusA/CzcA family heavy metal efflux RND transporter [Verrucomicrobiales bacterium]
MLNFLIRFSLTQRALIIALALVILGMGIWKLTQLPVEVLPDLTKPTVTILTEAPGFAPEEVETLITVPLENTLMGVNGVTRLRSTNDISLSLIFVEFDWDTDIYKARQFVQERLTGASETLPEGITPYMTPAASLMGEILLIGVTDPTGKTDPRDIRTIADWTLSKGIRSVPGIAEVLAMGGGVKQLHIQPLPNEMLALDVTFEEIREAAAGAVSNTTGGFLTESAQEIMVRNLAMTTNLDAIANTVVSYQDDRPIRIGDVASVTWDVEPMRGDAGMGSKHMKHKPDGDYQGYRGVLLSVTKSPGFDTIALTEAVEEKLKELETALPEVAETIILYRQSDFIHLAIDNVKEALRDGALMVAVILFLFLLNFRVTLITLTAIPLSLLSAVLVFDLFNLTVNSMTLGGFAVAIGMVVDDAIVDVENVFRRLRENAGRKVPRSKLEVIAEASAEVRSSILYATVLIILVFVPLLSLSGVEGRLFAPIAIATIVSMAASFVVSLTVIPVLSSLLLNPKPGKEHRDILPVRWLKAGFRNTSLRLSLDQPLLVIAVTLLLLAASFVIYSGMGGQFLPAFREPTAVVATTAAPGTSLKQTTELADAAMNQLLLIPDVETVGYRAGRAERGDHVVPVSTVEFDVEFDKETERSRNEIMEDIRDKMKTIPGTFSALSGPLADRIGHMLSGVSAKVAVKIYGPDLEQLRSIGTEIAEVARKIPGMEEAKIEQQAPIPQLRIEVDRDRALAYGVRPAELNEELAALMGGEAVAEVYEGQKIYDLVVRLPEEWRESPERLDDIYIDTTSGQMIPLRYVADIRQASGPNTILRENTRRRFVVSINPTTSDLNSAVEQLQNAVKTEVTLPAGYSIAFEGEYQAQAKAKERIAITSAVILLVIIFLLFSYFRSGSFVALVLSNIPISVVGGIFFTWMLLDTVSIASLVGLIAISGIAARNTIMLVSHYLHLMRHEGETFSRQMIIRGTEERLVPVLMTALSAGIALIPLVLASEAPGKEILNPVAVVIVGGLVTSTFLGLAVTPAVFYAFCRKAAEKSIAAGSAASE